MTRFFPAVAIIFGWVSAAWAADPGPLTSVRAVHALTNAEASQRLPVEFEATVTYFPGYDNLLFVQDGDAAVFVLASPGAKLAPGDRVLVKGTTRESFRPIVIPDSVTVLRHGELPEPVPAGFDELMRARYDCMLVSVHATIRSASLWLSPTARVTHLQMLMDGGSIDANVDSDDAGALKGLLDNEVEVTGVAGGKFDGKMQQIGALLHVSSLANVKILKRAAADPWSLPVTPLDQILTGYHVRDLTPRVRVHGTITYYRPGSAMVLQEGEKSLWISTPDREPFQIGDSADATGFPDAHSGSLALDYGAIEDSHLQAPVTPRPSTWRQLAFWSANQSQGHEYDLVSIEGQVVTETREAAQDEYVLEADGHTFTAVYEHQDGGGSAALPPMKTAPEGSKIRVTGICIIDDTNPFNTTKEASFHILLRSPADIAVVAKPSWLNIGNLIRVVSVLLLAVFAVAVWGATLDRKVRRQTAALSLRIAAEAALERRMAQLEQRRSRILEDINGSEPLAGILEKITEMVSYLLFGAPCWCEVADGARLGDYPAEAESLRIASEEIPGRSGPALGALFCGLQPDSAPCAPESEALTVGARLATLAIETRRLYSDLVHRSEFDQLTDIHNRFSLGKHLDALMEETREKAGIFGLIYIDLDEFKQVNDLYGHRIGDLYLQEVAVRMKRQLRSHDVLARLGGDEFAVLVPQVRNRAGVEEIAVRLERSFDEPFAMEGCVLHGSASVGIALYPEDGTSKDSLLSTADAAMYVSKHTRQNLGTTPDDAHKPGSRRRIRT